VDNTDNDYIDCARTQSSTENPSSMGTLQTGLARHGCASPGMTMLDRRRISAFFEDGFVVVPVLFSTSEIHEMRSAFVRLQRAAERLAGTGMHRGSKFVVERVATGGVRIQRIVWCGAAEPVLSAYGRDPRLLGMASTLLGTREMNQLINQAHYKLPGDGVEFPWHQDSSHRRFGGDQWRDVNERGSYVQTVIAIDDMTESNGSLRFLPGSCKLGHLDLPADGRLPRALVDPSSAVTATMRAGSVLLFGPYTLHSSQPNESDEPRRAFINGFAFPGANSRVYDGEGAGRLLRI